ncbi:ABC transporter ATP-binding protein [uncultured Corynebacterium sp.]|uniref:ABC transporter ATP-binding protein n=1 Tax=uncultured Corynebacterium sp. TaxID=159447 RepID=UPI0025FDDEE1|nr:ABC transporter ATP-binding protein [uncultured Corynebacterium sp.]
MRFPNATWPQVRRCVADNVKAIPGAGWRLVLALVVLSAGAASNILIPIWLGRIVDVVIAGEPQHLVGLTAQLLGAAAAAAILAALGFYLISRVTEKIIAQLRLQMVSTAVGLPTHRVEDAGTGDLVSRSTDDVAELSVAVTETAPVLSNSAFSIVATAIALVTLDWQFLLVVASAAPLYFFAARAYLKVAPGRYVAERESMATRARRVLEVIRGNATVRAFRLEDEMHQKVGQASWQVVERGYSARRTMITLQFWMTVVELVMLSAGLIAGYLATQSAGLSVGAVTAAMLLLIRLRGPLLGLMRILDTIQSGYASLARIVGVVIDPPRPVRAAGAPTSRGEVEMEGVSFGYGDGWAVEDVNLRVQPGQKIALVGASGAGKTTVAALVAGLRVPDAGHVTVDGVEVSALSDRERVARLALISQEVHVFSGTLREDLALAAPAATDAQMQAALDHVGFPELRDGLDTEVGARGQQLDPVAAQQLALARIFLLDPKVVIMDEATAEAGTSGAAVLTDAAQAVTQSRSALVVAHRLDQAYDADEILVMHSGRIIERGNHTQLVARGGQYARLWAAWKKGRDKAQ